MGNLTEWWEGFLWGGAGGLLPELVALFSLKTTARERWPEYFREADFYCLAVGYALVGGLFAWAYMHYGAKFNFMVAINVGVAWPALFAYSVKSSRSRIGGKNAKRRLRVDSPPPGDAP